MADLTSNLKSLVSSITLGLIIISCTFPEATLPSKTHEGKNTYGYNLTNSESKEIFSGISNTENDITIDSLNNHYVNFSNTIQGLYYDKQVELTISLNDNFDFKDSQLTYYYSNYITDSTQLNYCEITYLDTNKQIMSGFFGFNLIQVDSFYTDQNNSIWGYEILDSIQITSGRFDLKY